MWSIKTDSVESSLSAHKHKFHSDTNIILTEANLSETPGQWFYLSWSENKYRYQGIDYAYIWYVPHNVDYNNFVYIITFQSNVNIIEKIYINIRTILIIMNSKIILPHTLYPDTVISTSLT